MDLHNPKHDGSAAIQMANQPTTRRNTLIVFSFIIIDMMKDVNGYAIRKVGSLQNLILLK